MGKGAFTKTDNGWMIDTKVKVDGVWKHFVKRGYPTLQSAKADFERAKAEFIAKNQTHHKVMLFDDLLSNYTEFRSYKINESTIRVENAENNKYILNYFKGTLIKNAITVDSIVKWYRSILNNKNMKDNKKNKVFMNMKSILKYAYNRKYIDAEIYQDCDIEIVKINENDEHRKKIIWSEDEEKRFFDSIDDEVDSLMFRLFFLCATRISEFIGLQVKCIDTEKNQVKICQQVKLTENGTVLSNQLKSEQSYRIILITKKLSNELQEYINVFGLKENDFLWHSKSLKNKPINPCTFRNRLYHYCDKANVERIVPHGVRHNMAVKLAMGCENTQDIEICASRLGHTPSVFMNIYANHTKVQDQEKLMKKILNI